LPLEHFDVNEGCIEASKHCDKRATRDQRGGAPEKHVLCKKWQHDHKSRRERTDIHGDAVIGRAAFGLRSDVLDQIATVCRAIGKEACRRKRLYQASIERQQAGACRHGSK